MPSRRCWFADLPGAGACEGRLVRCHLIPRQTLKREVHTPRGYLRTSQIRKLIDDQRGWVWGCGGSTGIGGHHGRLDSRGCNPLRIPRHRLPPEFVTWCEEMGLLWFIEREYGLP